MKSLKKTITFRIIATLVLLVVSLWASKDIWVSLSITVPYAVINSFVYFFHEEAWEAYERGKKEQEAISAGIIEEEAN